MWDLRKQRAGLPLGWAGEELGRGADLPCTSHLPMCKLTEWPVSPSVNTWVFPGIRLYRKMLS